MTTAGQALCLAGCFRFAPLNYEGPSMRIDEFNPPETEGLPPEQAIRNLSEFAEDCGHKLMEMANEIEELKRKVAQGFTLQ